MLYTLASTVFNFGCKQIDCMVLLFSYFIFRNVANPMECFLSILFSSYTFPQISSVQALQTIEQTTNLNNVLTFLLGLENF